jgi:uncharacterized membrane protein
MPTPHRSAAASAVVASLRREKWCDSWCGTAVALGSIAGAFVASQRRTGSMKLRLSAALGVMLGLVGCSGSGDASCSTTDASCPTTTPSYATDVAPVIDTYCAGCHVSGGQESELPFTSLAQVQAHASEISREVSGCDMPPSDEDQPTDAERQLLLDWIACGAPDN